MMRYYISITLFLFLASHGARAFETQAREAIIMDADTQTVLLSVRAEDKMYPSSMSKLMTLYLLFDKLQSGAITLDSTMPVSEKAWKKGGSKMFVRVNTDVRVEDLIRGIVVQSGNDACIVVAEALGGSEEGFAKLMNEKAKAIGLKGSHFVNSTGWPDDEHYMTAADLATLTHRLVTDFPDYYPYFAEERFTYSGITQPNRNRLLGKAIGVDGLKTGHTEVAGYGIAVSGRDEVSGRRVHVVVNGLDDDKQRISEARRLVEHGLRDFVHRTLGEAGTIITRLPVAGGAEDYVNAVLLAPTHIALPRDETGLSFHFEADAPVLAPIARGDTLGRLSVRKGEHLFATLPIIAGSDIAEAGLWKRFWHNLGQMM